MNTQEYIKNLEEFYNEVNALVMNQGRSNFIHVDDIKKLLNEHDVKKEYCNCGNELSEFDIEAGNKICKECR